MENYAEYFTRDQEHQIHATTLRVLEEVGVRFQYQPALKILKKAGCTMDGNRVYFPAKLVEAQVQKAPSEFTLFGRTAEKDVVIGGDNTAFAPCYGPPFVICLDKGRRESTLEDFNNFVKLTHASKNLDIVGGVMVEPNDVPIERRTAEMVFASMVYSDKPFMGGVFGAKAARQTIEIAAMIYGGDKALADKPPFVSLLGACPPLAWDDTTLSAMMEYVKTGLPMLVNTMAIAGVSAPVTLEGALAVQNADILSGIIFVQLLREGTPVIFSASSTCANMRLGTLASGAPEKGVFTAATTQMARYYDIPCRTGSGSTDAKALDAQAGYEAMMGLLMSTVARVNFVISAAGLLESSMAASYEKFIIDEEMIGMCKRIKKGASVTAERLAFDVIKAGGLKGEFLTHPHTFENFRGELYLPILEERDNYEQWTEKGCERIEQKANRKWKEILANYQEPKLPGNVKKDLRKYIEKIC